MKLFPVTSCPNLVDQDLLIQCVGDVASDACTTRNLSFLGTTVMGEVVHATFMASLGQAFAEVKSVDNVIGQTSI